MGLPLTFHDQQLVIDLYFSYSTGADAASKLFQQAGRTYGDLKINGYTVNPSIEASEFVLMRNGIVEDSQVR